jgi:hypothetical protein
MIACLLHKYGLKKMAVSTSSTGKPSSLAPIFAKLSMRRHWLAAVDIRARFIYPAQAILWSQEPEWLPFE